MGWTIYNHTPTDERAEIMRLCTSDHLTPLVASKVGSTWYVAIECATADPDHYQHDARGHFVFAAVILTTRRGGEWGYKAMEESMGPNEARCPKYILDILSPLNPDAKSYAAEWRQRCEDQRQKKTGAQAFKVGDKIRLPAPLTFTDGTTADTFTVTTYRRGSRNMRAYHAEGVGLCRIDARHLEGAQRIA